MATLNNVNSVSLDQREMEQLVNDLKNNKQGFTTITGRVTPMGNESDLDHAVRRNMKRLNKA